MATQRHEKRRQAKRLAEAWQDKEKVEAVRQALEKKEVSPYTYRIPSQVYEREGLRPSWMKGSKACKRSGDRALDGSRCGRRSTEVWTSKHGGLPNYPV